MTRPLRIGTRGSELALWQARQVASALAAKVGVESELVVIHTTGDRDRSRALYDVGGSGLFTKELQAALLRQEVDLVVHSLKDLPTQEPAGLALGAVCFREDPCELLLARQEAVGPGPLGLRPGAVLGTSSLRRRAQALACQGDLQVKPLRGNVPTRLAKLRRGEYDAILLAFAGIHRLGLDTSDLVARKLPLELMLPAPAQGALGVEVRAEDHATRELLAQLHDATLACEVEAERLVLVGLGGGCHIPLGAHCTRQDGQFVLRAALGELDENLALLRLQRAAAQGASPRQVAQTVLEQLAA